MLESVSGKYGGVGLIISGSKGLLHYSSCSFTILPSPSFFLCDLLLLLHFSFFWFFKWNCLRWSFSIFVTNSTAEVYIISIIPYACIKDIKYIILILLQLSLQLLLSIIITIFITIIITIIIIIIIKISKIIITIFITIICPIDPSFSCSNCISLNSYNSQRKWRPLSLVREAGTTTSD